MTPLDPAGTDPSHNVLRGQQQPLDVIFRPKTIAVVGATDRVGSVGRTVFENLTKGEFAGSIYAVNPNRHDVLGARAYSSLGEVPSRVDLAVIVTPAVTVPGVIRECVSAGVGSAVVISAGFKESGPDGARLESEVLAAARSTLRVVGPNCLGIMNPRIGLNATFARTIALDGSVAFLSQSGALCTAILDWSLQEAVGFSAFVSTGSMLDVGWGDLIYYFGDDPHTNSILLYMESVGEPRAFLSAAREVSRTKPIIVIKAGRTAAAAKAAASHTGALTGSDEVLDAAFRRCGVLRVNGIAELFEIAEVLGKQPRPRGPRLTILTNAGGPGVLATDALLASGGQLASLSPATMDALNDQLPPHWSHGNPVDVLGDAGAERYAGALQTVLGDAGSDGLLAILAPQGMTDPTRIAEVLALHAHKKPGVPILASWMGGAAMAEGEALLRRAGIPTFPFPDAATRAFTYLWDYAQNLRALAQTPVLPPPDEASLDRTRAAQLIQNVRDSGRTLFTEWESKQLLVAYGIPTVRTETACDEDEAVARAAAIGYPVVVKLHSETITHKTDVGGVRLNIGTPDAVRTAFRDIRAGIQGNGTAAFGGVTVQPMVRLEGYELILGSTIDSQFGPVLLFGTGGQLVEVFRDHALGLPPLTTTLARLMIERTRISIALAGTRGRGPVDHAALEMVLVRFSQLVAEQRRIKEVDINPLLASPSGILALDARIVLHDSTVADDSLPVLAIRPYPEQYTSSSALADGVLVRIRPIRPEDEPLMVHFHERLSRESVYLRYLEHLKVDQRTAHERLSRICFIDYDREMALVALDGTAGKEEVVAVGRLSKFHGNNIAEFSMLVRDDFQRRGLGSLLLQRLLEIARVEKMVRIVGFILPENVAMQKIAARLGFTLTSDADVVIASRDLGANSNAPS